MRPHRLSLTAFGSFPGTETVDFDALAAAGLFLVHGPTGAGKTTILDALCFALYGQVPGQRNSARSLRCDHAPPTVGPSVTLEVTLRGRLLRIQRSPAWQRPKRRGSGFTEEKSKVVLSEWQGADWHGLTTRLDEAGDLVSGLLGMNAGQFCQVAMLPQGEFAKFLRADGDERSKLLERLFTVKIFTAAESWLAEHRKMAWREAQELRQEVDFAVKRVEEVAGDDLAATLTGPVLATPAPDGSPSEGLAPEGLWSDRPLPEGTPSQGAPSEGAVSQEALFEGLALDGLGSEGAVPNGLTSDSLRFKGAVGKGPAPDGLGSAKEPSEGPTSGRPGSEGAPSEDDVPTPDSDPLRWAGALLDAARAVVRRTDEEQVAGGQALRAARMRFDRAAALADRQRRYAEALTLRRTLDERADERADLQAILDDAARADRVRPLIMAARQRAEVASKSRTMAADALARARPLLTTRNGDVAARDADVGARNGDLTTRNGDVATHNGDLTTRDGDVATHNGDLTAYNGDVAARNGDHQAYRDTPRTAEPSHGQDPTRGGAASAHRDVLPGDDPSARGGSVSAGDPSARGVSVPGGGRAEGREPDRSWGPSVAELARLERLRQDEIARLQELLTEEGRLSVVRRDLLRVEEELAELVRTDEAVAARLARLPELIAQAESKLAEARVDAARIPAARDVRDAAAHLIEIDRELSRLAAELEELAQREAEVAAAEAELPERLADAGAELAEARAQAAAVPAAAATLDAARAVREATHRRETLAAELEAAVARHQVLVDQAQNLRERWLDLRQARIDGMAAELARDLSDGSPCAVCGSEHHPHPASPAESAPSADDEHAAEAAHEAAMSDRENAERALASLESRHADAVEATGDLNVDDAEEQVDLAVQELARLQAIADREPALTATLDRIETERERVRDRAREIAEALAAHRAHRRQLESERTRIHTRLIQAIPADNAGIVQVVATGDHAVQVPATGGRAAEVDREPDEVMAGAGDALDGPVVLAAAERELRRLEASAGREAVLAQEAGRLGRERLELEERGRRVTARLAAGRTRHEELSGDAGRLSAKLDAARGDDATLTARLTRLNDEAELLRDALEATQSAVAAREELAAARRAAEEAAFDAGFGDVREAEAAYRSPAEREGKAELLRRLDDEHAAVSGVLADPELVAAAAEPVQDLAAMGAERDALEQAYTRLSSARDRAEARARRLEELHEELSARIERWRPAAEAHRLAERMAALASGTSSDNQWSMSLSSYVLGERLRQVVDAANERLDHMSAGRYLLRHDLRKTAGSRTRAGGGLGLRVADGWTGVDRDPATLSGGESFITSLALALGLADVVTAEAGGAELGTLFVDEGFGTLDEDTLDGVLDILDGLRDGGRAVGIVSHVAELRSRITAQLQVTKTRTGSTLRAVGVR